MKNAAYSYTSDPTAGDLEYLSWFGYSPLGVCPTCGEEWNDLMFAYDGPHCSPRRNSPSATHGESREE